MKTIAFIDMSAGYKGVHNMGFLDALYTYIQDTDINFVVATHYAISKNWQNKLESKNIAVIKSFTGNFYQFSNQKPNISQVSPYIFQLSQEYLQSFKILLENRQENIYLVFHSMSWEHLQALSLAMSKLQDKRLFFHVFLMYWCGIDENQNYQDIFLSTQYKIALAGLLKQNNVKMYTSNKEYQKSYLMLLDGKIPINLHPFFLGDWNKSMINKKSQDFQNILLYCGEVKQDKGFFELPRMLKNLIKNEKLIIKNFIIQLARENLSIEQKNICKELKIIANKNNVNIDFINEFMDTKKLLELYRKCDLALLNYDRFFYSQKTSGILWLSIQQGIICMVPNDTWLQRELEYLKQNYYVIYDDKIEFIPHNVQDLNPKILDYKQKIFQPFWQWLNKL